MFEQKSIRLNIRALNPDPKLFPQNEGKKKNVTKQTSI
ncbi:hypothetical protein C943_04346 [Mariniradius saccharolyticus AK6]|uniref:Uncharacterized protein n=1 Tax=Mariniradius saccharolyticus AK6 TaxID=1239962 RepID=M7XFZ8_9BACT|nr:hypothetical protein C943_04346 [Mariniradius saccharolyticus AK6]